MEMIIELRELLKNKFNLNSSSQRETQKRYLTSCILLFLCLFNLENTVSGGVFKLQ